MTTPPPNQLPDIDRAVYLDLLQEQEILAQMEQARSREELEEITMRKGHERRLEEILRQDEIDSLWEQIQGRRRVAELERRLEQLRINRDLEQVMLEIEHLRRQRQEAHGQRQVIRREMVEKMLEADPTDGLAASVDATESVAGRIQAASQTGVATAKLCLNERLDIELENIEKRMNQLLQTPGFAAAGDGRPGAGAFDEAQSHLLGLDLGLPAPACIPNCIILATRGVARLDHFPPEPNSRARVLQGYVHSTRALSVVRYPQGDQPILLAGHRRGVTHLDPAGGQVIATYGMAETKHYAINAAEFADDGRLVATHSEVGLLAWADAQKQPQRIGGDIRSARLLRRLRDGRMVFSSNDQLYLLEPRRNDRLTMLRNFNGRTITSLSVTNSVVVVSDNKGAVSLVEIEDPKRDFAPILLEESVHCVGVVDWRGTTWVAASIRRRDNVYLTLQDIRNDQAPLMLAIPARVHIIRQAGPGVFAACSENYLSYWDLNRDLRSVIVPLHRVGNVQDFAFMQG